MSAAANGRLCGASTRGRPSSTLLHTPSVHATISYAHHAKTIALSCPRRRFRGCRFDWLFTLSNAERCAELIEVVSGISTLQDDVVSRVCIDVWRASAYGRGLIDAWLHGCPHLPAQEQRLDQAFPAVMPMEVLLPY